MGSRSAMRTNRSGFDARGKTKGNCSRQIPQNRLANLLEKEQMSDNKSTEETLDENTFVESAWENRSGSHHCWRNLGRVHIAPGHRRAAGRGYHPANVARPRLQDGCCRFRS